jgi:hypothetical protein
LLERFISVADSPRLRIGNAAGVEPIVCQNPVVTIVQPSNMYSLGPKAAKTIGITTQWLALGVIINVELAASNL